MCKLNSSELTELEKITASRIVDETEVTYKIGEQREKVKSWELGNKLKEKNIKHQELFVQLTAILTSLMTASIFIITFSIGKGWLVYSDYHDILKLYIVEHGASVFGLCYIVAKYLFPSKLTELSIQTPSGETSA